MSTDKIGTVVEFDKAKWDAECEAEEAKLDKCFFQLREARIAIELLNEFILDLRGPAAPHHGPGEVYHYPKNLGRLEELADEYLSQAMYLIEGPRHDGLNSKWLVRAPETEKY